MYEDGDAAKPSFYAGGLFGMYLVLLGFIRVLLVSPREAGMVG